MKFRSGAISLATFGMICQFAACAWGQSYPTKFIRYLLPYEAGGGNDVMARIMAAGLTQALGQQVIVENRPGAAGNIGTEVAARAPADGYTVVQISAGNAVNMSLYRNLPFDLVRDFAAVTRLASFPAVLVVHPSLRVKSINELVRLAKSRPGELNYASAGRGTPSFFSAELFKRQAGLDIVHVPYRGGGASLTAIISGETAIYFPPPAVALPFLRQGRLHGVGVTSAVRLRILPDLPTIAETGYPGYESVNWYGLLVPAGTAKESIATLRNAAVSVLNDSTVNKRLVEMGNVIVGDQPEDFTAYIKSEIAVFANIIKQTGIRVD